MLNMTFSKNNSTEGTTHKREKKGGEREREGVGVEEKGKER